jgi:uncharacterized protein YndB with AHSA1/START domain
MPINHVIEHQESERKKTMLTFEHDDTFDYPAAQVFALLTDLEARPRWLSGIIEDRVTPPGPARPGTSLFEAGKFSGFKSEKTLTVSEFEQDRLLTLATPADAHQLFRESYRIEPISEGASRLHFAIEIGGAPKVAEFFIRQAMAKELPQMAARLKSVLVSRSA